MRTEVFDSGVHDADSNIPLPFNLFPTRKHRYWKRAAPQRQERPSFEVVCRGLGCRTAKARLTSQLTAIAELKWEWDPLVLNGNAKKAPILRFTLRQEDRRQE